MKSRIHHPEQSPQEICESRLEETGAKPCLLSHNDDRSGVGLQADKS